MAPKPLQPGDPTGTLAWIAAAWVMAKSLCVALNVGLTGRIIERLFADFGHLPPPFVQAVPASVVRGLLLGTAAVALLGRVTLGTRKWMWIVLAVGWVFAEGIETLWLEASRLSLLELLK